ncbi:MAG: TIGR01906 family membrane protein [Streptococcaceae bacterium]|nr:TIGR01906 family membrane protein [Streptococcaceae bacterium]
MNKKNYLLWQVGEFFGKFAIIMFVISGAALLTIHNRSLYQFVLHRENLGQHVGLSNEVVLKNYDILMSYMNNPFKEVLDMPDFPSSRQGLQHFAEVRVLFIFAIGVFIVSTLLGIWYVLRMRREKTYWKLINLGKISMVAPIVLGLMSVMMFNQIFYWFHRLLFRNDYWIYDPKVDPIILVLPESYFLYCFLFFFIVVEVAFFLVYLKGKKSL